MGWGIVRLTPTRVLVVGGGATEGADARLELFDAATLHSEFLAQTLLEARDNPTASLLPDGRVLVVGGGFTHNMVHQTRRTAEVQDLQRGSSTLIALPHGLDFHTTTVLPDGRAVVVGGCETGPDPMHTLDQVLLLDPVAGTVKQIATLPQPLAGHTATLLSDGSILIAGGTGDVAMASVDYRFYPAVAERMQSN